MPVMTLNDKQIAAVLSEIRRGLGEADTASANWDVHREPGEEEMVEYYLHRAFTQTLVLLELCALPKTSERIEQLYEQAKKDLIKTDYSRYSGVVYLE